MKRKIRKVAVLGSGVMGSRIACHFAGVGVQVLLLDIAPTQLTPHEQARSLSLNDASVKNRLVNEALAAAVKSSPSPLYFPEAIQQISTGNFTDDLPKLANCDWIIEVVVENLQVKQGLFAEVEKYRTPGTLITSNTSGIPIHMMAAGRSDDFKAHFCGTHFFNPPRYLRLLEIIPTTDTKQEVVDFLLHFGSLYLGKTSVLAKDTPAFIANRIGVFSMMLTFKLMEKYELTIDEVDYLTGPLIGHPKSATFRTADIVGIDTLVSVAKGVAKNCPEDEAREIYTLPGWLNKIVEAGWLGDKSGQGFYKKLKKNDRGDKNIEVLNLQTFEYEPRQKVRFPELETVRNIESFLDRLTALLATNSKAGHFLKELHYGLFSYASHRIPEIADHFYRIDEAMSAGFGWEAGPFVLWDALHPASTFKEMDALGYTPAAWVTSMLQQGNNTFYELRSKTRQYYDIAGKEYRPIDGLQNLLILGNFRNQTVWKNSACSLTDIGDEVLSLDWKTKMNTMGGEVLEGINTAVNMAEKNYRGLVMANEGANFSAGANVAMIFLLAVEQEFEELDMAVRLFQDTMLRLRYAAIPVVAAPHGLALGGGCEVLLHTDKVCAAAETYIGLVEAGVGLIPAGGGTKEFALRAANETHADEPELNTLKNRFFNIATANVSTSAHTAFSAGVLRNGLDEVIVNQERRIAEAKKSVITLHRQGYTAPTKKPIRVLGRSALGALMVGINSMHTANYATEHDAKVARKLANVICGGDLSEPTLVPEQYLLDLEREAFLSLCGERKTLERMESLLTTGKPIRN